MVLGGGCQHCLLLSPSSPPPTRCPFSHHTWLLLSISRCLYVQTQGKIQREVFSLLRSQGPPSNLLISCLNTHLFPRFLAPGMSTRFRKTLLCDHKRVWPYSIVNMRTSHHSLASGHEINTESTFKSCSHSTFG